MRAEGQSEGENRLRQRDATKPPPAHPATCQRARARARATSTLRRCGHGMRWQLRERACVRAGTPGSGLDIDEHTAVLVSPVLCEVVVHGDVA